MNESKKYKIGILGAGQLGTFLADTCVKKNISSWCLFYESENDPGASLHKKNAVKLFDDVAKRKKQFEKCEYILLESEFYSYEELKKVNAKFIPDIESYKNFYGKTKQRTFYDSLGLNCPKYKIISDVSSLDNIESFPVILKRNLFSYDGNGNRECHNFSELHKYAMELGFPLLVEEKLKLKAEFSVGLVAAKNQMLILPLTETFQKNHICHFVLGPYAIEKKLEDKLNIEMDKLKKSNLFGLFAFEFFITEDDQIIINEGAARPHNSLHITQDLLDHSQFDYIVDLALNPNTIETYQMTAQMGAMINLLGKKVSHNPTLSLGEIPLNIQHHVYLYGKKEGRVGRKLGHINLLNSTLTKNEFTNILDKVYEEYSI